MNIARLNVAAFCVLSAALCASATVIGVVNKKVNVPAKMPGEEAGEFSIDVECRGNQKTSVLIKGDHRPVTDLEIVVYELGDGDVQGKVVARDRGARDLLGAVWTPARQSLYRIVIRNPSEFVPKINPFNECYLTIK